MVASANISNTEKLNDLYDGLRAADQIIAKVLGISEWAQVARIETRLRRFLTVQWRNLSKQAIKKGVAQFKKGKGTPKVSEAPRISAAVDRVMKQWAPAVSKRVQQDTEEVYRLARTVGLRRALGIEARESPFTTSPFVAEIQKVKQDARVLPSFDVEDKKAIEALQKQQQFWIGEHYGANVAGQISAAVSEAIGKGLPRTQTGNLIFDFLKKELEFFDVPGGFKGTDKQYFEALSANAATSARAQGQIKSYKTLDITSYEIINPLDERTCPVCSHMNGKVFKTTQGIESTDKLVGSTKTPSMIKDKLPWLTVKQIREISPKIGFVGGSGGVKDSEKLTAAGFNLPPFHFRCRCDVIVAAA